MIEAISLRTFLCTTGEMVCKQVMTTKRWYDIEEKMLEDGYKPVDDFELLNNEAYTNGEYVRKAVYLY